MNILEGIDKEDSAQHYGGAGLEWRSGLEPREWDDALAMLSGHPLQSSLWGDARAKAEGTECAKWIVLDAGRPVWMARIETRWVPFLGKVAWIPRGPVSAQVELGKELELMFYQRLRHAGFVLCVTDYWYPVDEIIDDRPRTIWIDLNVGKDALWKRLDKQWRYGVGYAARQGVVVQRSTSEDHLAAFFRLCKNISQTKGFKLPATHGLMQNLLKEGQDGSTQARLFVAHHKERFGAGAFVLRCGKHIHYMWGATDRELSKLRVGEAVQWAVMEWALEEGCTLYDLEGIDPVNNLGTYKFKKKMGGDEVTLQGMRSYPLNWRGSAVKCVGRLTGRI